MEEIIFVFMDDYPDWECAEALYFIATLGADRYEIKAVGISQDPVHSISGVSIIPDYTIEEAVGKFSGIVLVGGIGWMTRMDERIAAVKPLIDDAVERGCSIGGVGTGTDVLGTFGLLNNAVHVGNSASELYLVSDLGHASVPYTGEALFRSDAGAVRNGPVVTARNISGLAFARAYLWTLHVDQTKADEMYSRHKAGAMLSMIDAEGEFEAQIL